MQIYSNRAFRISNGMGVVHLEGTVLMELV
jgi:hypothetical protein